MKMNRFAAFVAAVGVAFSMQSCLDYDVTGDEFDSTTTNVKSVTARGAVDSIPYKSATSAEEIQKVRGDLDQYLFAAKGSQYAMRGGKNGEFPGEHAYQYQFVFGADIYAHYGVIPHTYFPYSKINVSSAYNISENAYGGASGSFGTIAKTIVPLLNHEKINAIPEIKAIFLLLYNYSSVELADIYGPFAYQELKTNKQDYPYTYQDVRSIYYTVKENLDTITACLKYFDTKPTEYKQAVYDILIEFLELTHESTTYTYSNLDSWIRFANSLQLRMAMHLSKVEPLTAKKWAEDAVAGGVIENENQEVRMLQFNPSYKHPLLGVYAWGDVRMTASMESLLKSLNHPYVMEDEARGLTGDYLFEKNSDALVNKTTQTVTPARSRVAGMRTGAHPGEGQGYEGNQYVAFSKLNTTTFATAPLYLMKLSEVCFLRAEGVLRGWNMGGEAKDFYEKGVRAANFEDRVKKQQTFNGRNLYDALVDDYLNQDKPVAYTYVDPTGETPSIESVTKIGVKWNESDNLETKLEKIITQKYIAGFPYSFEAWVDLRRTGYPKLFEVLNVDEADGSLKQGDMMRRLYFPGRQDPSIQQDIKTTGIPALNGPDVLGTRLWWDVDVPNFQ